MVMTSESSVFIKMTLAKKKKGNGVEREEAEKWKNQENLHIIFRDLGTWSGW